jgi:hypothetical protein
MGFGRCPFAARAVGDTSNSTGHLMLAVFGGLAAMQNATPDPHPHRRGPPAVPRPVERIWAALPSPAAAQQAQVRQRLTDGNSRRPRSQLRGGEPPPFSGSKSAWSERQGEAFLRDAIFISVTQFLIFSIRLLLMAVLRADRLGRVGATAIFWICRSNASASSVVVRGRCDGDRSPRTADRDRAGERICRIVSAQI